MTFLTAANPFVFRVRRARPRVHSDIHYLNDELRIFKHLFVDKQAMPSVEEGRPRELESASLLHVRALSKVCSIA
ncbi:hypothetical protein [Burkholderia gladioli]|uniref:hypothetical protein n=1 Tax=Burkholderia gladioli TaxID=28095 RepID=UPI00163EE43E|nr:hypothetical protein [Burkholderia gladioli]